MIDYKCNSDYTETVNSTLILHYNFNDNIYELRNKDIGFIFQNFNLLPRLNALENVILPLLYSGKSSKERTKLALLALENVGLKDRTETDWFMYSDTAA